MRTSEKLRLLVSDYPVGTILTPTILSKYGLYRDKMELRDNGVIERVGRGQYVVKEGFDKLVSDDRTSILEKFAKVFKRYNKGDEISYNEMLSIGFFSGELTKLVRLNCLARNDKGLYTLLVGSVQEFKVTYEQNKANAHLVEKYGESENKKKEEVAKVEKEEVVVASSVRAKDSTDLGLLNMMYDALMNRRWNRAMDILHEFLSNVNGLEYEQVMLGMLRVSLLDANLGFTRVLQDLFALENGSYSLSVEMLIDDYFDALLIGNKLVANGYLDILFGLEALKEKGMVKRLLEEAKSVDIKELKAYKNRILILISDKDVSLGFDVPNLELILEQVLEYGANVVSVSLSYGLNLTQINYVKLELAKEYKRRGIMDVATSLIREVEKSKNKNDFIDIALERLKNEFNNSLK